MTPRVLRTGPEKTGTASHLRGPSDLSLSHTGKMVDLTGLGNEYESPGIVLDTTGTRTRARVAWDIWSTPQAIGAVRDSSGTAGPHRRPSDTSPSRPGELVDPTAPRTCPESPREMVNPAGPRNRALVAWDRWSIPRALGQGPESHGTDGRPRGSLDINPSCPGVLVDTAGPRTRVRVAWDIWSTLRAIGAGRKSTGTAGQHRGPSDTSPSHRSAG